jgi:putative hydrolase of the HAD superfamily
MSIHPIQDFVFDFGAVIFEWNPIKRIEQHFKGEWHGFKSSTELAKNLFGSPTWQGFDRGDLSMSDVINQSAENLNIDRDHLRDLIEPIGEDLTPIESSILILNNLVQRKKEGEEIRLFYLSNMPEPYARALERRHEFIKWFDAGIFSADVREAKPDVKIYQRLYEKYGLDAARTLFIDDQLLNIQAAQSLGWRGVHLESPELLHEKLLPYWK